MELTKGKPPAELRRCPFFLVLASRMREEGPTSVPWREVSQGQMEAVVGGGGVHWAAGWEWPQGTGTLWASAGSPLSPAGLCRNCRNKEEAWSPRWGSGPLGDPACPMAVAEDARTVFLLSSAPSYCSVLRAP